MFVLRCSLAVIVALILGMSFAVPSGDVFEIVYDESDSQPFGGTPILSIALLTHFAPVTTPTLGARCRCRQVSRDFDYYTESPFPISDLNFINRSLRC